MTGLVLKLGPKERLLINGAVIENGDRRARINIITPNANILRLRDALHPTEANTPVKRVCYVIQLILSGDVSSTEASSQLLKGLEQLSQVFRDTDSREVVEDVSALVLDEKYYPALKSLRSLIGRERRLFANGQS